MREWNCFRWQTINISLHILNAHFCRVFRTELLKKIPRYISLTTRSLCKACRSSRTLTTNTKYKVFYTYKHKHNGQSSLYIAILEQTHWILYRFFFYTSVEHQFRLTVWLGCQCTQALNEKRFTINHFTENMQQIFQQKKKNLNFKQLSRKMAIKFHNFSCLYSSNLF